MRKMGSKIDFLNWPQTLPSTSFGVVFPSEDSYHPLYKHSKLEIFKTIQSIDGNNELSADEKKECKDQVEAIVKKIPIDSSKASGYFSIIILIIFFLLMIIFFAFGAKGWGIAFLFLQIFAGIVVLYKFTLGLTFAENNGRNDWGSYISAYDGFKKSNKSDSEIIDALRNEELAEAQMENDRKIAMMQRNNYNNYNNGRRGTNINLNGMNFGF